MWMMFLACAIGTTDPAADGSPSAQAATQAQVIADKAGAITNAARELEQMTAPAREGVAQGEDPQLHMKKMRAKMAEITALEAELQAEIAAFENGLSAGD